MVAAEPLALPALPMIAHWYAGEAGDALYSLSDINPRELVIVCCYWPVSPAPQLRDSVELDIRAAKTQIHTVLGNDSDLAGNVTDLKFRKAEAGFTEIGGGTYRVLRVPVELWMYEEAPAVP